jgi:RES domain-containing protein
MTPLPAPLGGKELVAWRLDREAHRETWDSGEGAYRSGGRWSGQGVRAVYCSIDPATAILEVAVHKGFRALDIVAHILTELRITEPQSVHVVDPAFVPDPNWLRPGVPTVDQQTFGNALLSQHKFILVPSVVSTHSWNLVFVRTAASTAYLPLSQERFALDPRLHPSAER